MNLTPQWNSRAASGLDAGACCRRRRRGGSGWRHRCAKLKWLQQNPLVYDRESGTLTGAGMIDRIAVLARQAGSPFTRPFGYRGYGLGCKAVSAAVASRDIVVRLTADAAFAIPFADGDWSRLLNSRYDYEEEIEAFLRSAADLNYMVVDCGTNFGYWSVLASSRSFGAQTALAIEASPQNAKRLEVNARLNGGRLRCLNAAILGRAEGFARVTGSKHEALATYALTNEEQGAVRIVSLDSLVAQAFIDPSIPRIVKLDVEGVEIEALKGATNLLSGNAVVTCEEHGSDRSHGVIRHLLSAKSLKVYVFDPSLSRFVPVDGLDVLDRVKRYRWVGYNVFATSSKLWQECLLSTRWSYR